MNVQRVIVVNENDEEIGTMPMSEAHRNGTPHRIAITYVENTAGQFLVQIRRNGVSTILQQATWIRMSPISMPRKENLRRSWASLAWS